MTESIQVRCDACRDMFRVSGFLELRTVDIADYRFVACSGACWCRLNEAKATIRQASPMIVSYVLKKRRLPWGLTHEI